ncbi:hypothetical protein KW805_02155 [Candidatus Pacearchaeota archaeon]|nr:hypothetical protein [Candidatus Pacearchaeota archaeon]
MSSEYVRITVAEKLYGQKHLLHSQLSLLNSVKRMRGYEKLRKEENLLKIELKKTVLDALNSLEILEKMLPKGNFITHKPAIRYDMMQDKEVITIEEELNAIKKKLTYLQG